MCLRPDCGMCGRWRVAACEWEPERMDAPFPSPPNLDRTTAQALVEWLDAMAEWLSADHATAGLHGHEVSRPSLNNLDLYTNAALLICEAYGLG